MVQSVDTKPVAPAAEHREWLGWAGCAVAALCLATLSDLVPHRVWGLSATAGYGAAGWCAVRRRGRPAAVAVVGAVALPLVLLVVAGRWQLEVSVVERSAALLLDTGSPYTAAPAVLEDVNPYLPGMALLGLPHALFGDGPLTDARWWMGGAFLLSLGAAARPGAVRRLPIGVAACPLVALPLAVGGIDLPVVALMCWGLGLAGRGRAGRGGLVLGVAAALKWTAWPALAVALALLAVRSGGRPAVRFAGVALAAVAALVAPFALVRPGALVDNVVAFPLGLGPVASPADSPFPGRLLADHVPGGAVAATALLAVSALLLALSLAVRPPRTVTAAANRLALGLTLAIALMPASRFGYLVYPFVLLAWAGADSGRTLPWAPHPARSSFPTTFRPGRAASRPSSMP